MERRNQQDYSFTSEKVFQINLKTNKQKTNEVKKNLALETNVNSKQVTVPLRTTTTKKHASHQSQVMQLAIWNQEVRKRLAILRYNDTVKMVLRKRKTEDEKKQSSAQMEFSVNPS